jgi:hypothetical protein
VHNRMHLSCQRPTRLLVWAAGIASSRIDPKTKRAILK